MILKVSLPGKLQMKFSQRETGLFMMKQGDIHYIGGTEVLPPPLSADKESEMIRCLTSEEDEGARAVLIEHNLRLVVYIAKKFDNTGVGVEDLISIGTIGLIKSVNTYNADKNIKLATYASRCIENEILMYLRRNNKTKLEVSIDEPLNVDWDGNELLLSDILGTDEDVIYRDLENEVERKLLGKAIEKLSENQNRLEGAIEKLTENQNQMEGSIKRLESAIEKLTENQLIFAEQQKQIVAAIGGLTTRMDRFEKRLDSMENRIDRLEGRMSNFEDALNRMDDRLLLQQKSIDRIHGSLVDIYERFNHLEKQTTENTQYISALMDGQLRMQITMEKNHQELCRRFDSLEHDFMHWRDITEQHSLEITRLKKAQ